MKYTKFQRRRAHEAVQKLPECTVEELKDICRLLGVSRGRMVQGGRYKPFRKDELMRQIRRCVGRGTFAERLERFANAVGGAVMLRGKEG